MEDRILVNDIIIINKDKRDNAYSMFDKWFELYGISINNYNKCLTEHIERDNIDEKYRCIWVAPHPTLGRMLYAIEGLDTKQVFLINTDAILGYYHTFNSFDNTEKALKILSSECYNLDMELRKIKSCINEQSEATTDDSNVMPELKAGMFGIAKCLPDGNISAFYVTEDTIIYENGNWDLHSIFDETGKSGYTQILALYSEDVKSFKGVWAFYYDIDNPNPSDLIWKKID